MVGDGNVHVSIVVDVAKIRRPALLVKDQAALKGFLGPPALAIIDPQLVDASGIM